MLSEYFSDCIENITDQHVRDSYLDMFDPCFAVWVGDLIHCINNDAACPEHIVQCPRILSLFKPLLGK